MSFEARSESAEMWKKLVDSIKDLVTEVNLQCSPKGITLQSMDPAHVALVALSLNKDGFDMFHTERNTVLGINMANLAKVLKTIESRDQLTLRHQGDDNTLSVIGESVKRDKDGNIVADDVGRRTTEFALKLMEIDAEEMGVPEGMDYKTIISLSSSEFSKICRDMAVLGDTITVSVDREGVTFSADGDLGGGKHVYKCDVKQVRAGELLVKPDPDADQDAALPAVKREIKREVKQELDEDAPLVDQFKTGKGAKAKRVGAASQLADDEDGAGARGSKGPEIAVTMVEPIELSFALRYFNNFAKGGALSDRVTLHLSSEQPAMVEFLMDKFGSLRYFLAPKVEAAD